MRCGPMARSLLGWDDTKTLPLWLRGHLVGYAVVLDISISGKKTVMTENVEYIGCKLRQADWYLRL